MAAGLLNTIPTFDRFAALIPSGQGAGGLTAEVFRNASQSQSISQNSNAFSGAHASNDFSDLAEITQDASAANSTDATIHPAQGSSSGAGGLSGPHTSFISIGGPVFGSAIGAFFQDQGGGQNSFANGSNFQGLSSSAGNNLALNEDLQAVLDARNDISVDVQSNLGSQAGSPTSVLVSQGGDGGTTPASQGGTVEHGAGQAVSSGTGQGRSPFHIGSVLTPISSAALLQLTPFTSPRGFGRSPEETPSFAVPPISIDISI